MPPVRIGVIGGGDSIDDWIEAVTRRTDTMLVAVSDRDAQRTAPMAARHQAAFEPDARTLLMQHVPDAVVIARSPAGAEPLLPAAAERGVAVLLDAPPARTLDEAVHRDRMFSRAALPLVVASGWRFDPAMDVCRRSHRDLGRVCQGQLQFCAPPPHPLGWRGDRLRSGGGVLLTSAYDWIDALIAAMGLPADVLFHTLRANRAEGPAYDTEDLAGGIMRFAEGQVATVSARWGPPPHGASLLLGGRQRTAAIGSDRVIIHGPAGSLSSPAGDPLPEGETQELIRSRESRQEISLDHLLSLLGDRSAPKSPAGRPHPDGAASPPTESAAPAGNAELARSQSTGLDKSTQPASHPADLPDTMPPARSSCMRDHFAVLAVIEAAYLSDRTGAPEPPHQVFERCGLSAP